MEYGWLATSHRQTAGLASEQTAMCYMMDDLKITYVYSIPAFNDTRQDNRAATRQLVVE